MKKTLVVALGLLLGSLWAEDPAPPQVASWSIYVNGVRNGANVVSSNGQDWFDAQQLVAALGYRLNVTPQGCFINGQPLSPQVTWVAGIPYTTAEAVARTVGARMSKDQVRTSVYYELSAQNPAGIPYYNSDYITADEEYKRNRRKELAMSPGEVMMEDHDAKMAEEWRKKHPFHTYVPRASDYVEMSMDHSEMPGIMSEEELLNQQTTYRNQKAPPAPSGYLQRSANNGVFQVNISDVKLAEALKGMKPPLLPSAGNKFLVVHLSLENVSKSKQRPGWFNMRDQNGLAFPANSLYSQFSQGEMQVREVTKGYLIFEIPMSAQPVALEALVSPALSLSLIYK